MSVHVTLTAILAASVQESILHTRSPAQAFLLIAIFFLHCVVQSSQEQARGEQGPRGGRENKAWLLRGSVKRQLLHLPGSGGETAQKLHGTRPAAAP